jgi:hypothetical protein
MTLDEEMATPDIRIQYDDRAMSAQTLESACEQFEGNYQARAQYRWKGQERWQGRENEEMRLVNILSPTGFIRKLRAAGIDAREEAPHFYVFTPDDATGKLVAVKKERSTGRLWLHSDAIQDRVGISAWGIENGQRVRKMVTWLQYPWGPEWSLMHFDEFDVPIAERYRGWRTVLLHLVMRDILTEAEVNRAFGPVPLSPVSALYRESMQHHREKQGGLRP